MSMNLLNCGGNKKRAPLRGLDWHRSNSSKFKRFEEHVFGRHKNHSKISDLILPSNP